MEKHTPEPSTPYTGVLVKRFLVASESTGLQDRGFRGY